MIRIAVGEVYTAKRARSGSSGKGPWELLVVESGKDEMTLWVSNPGTGITDNRQFVIKSIDFVTKKNVAYKDGRICRDRRDRDVTWKTEVDLNVTVEPIGYTYSGLDVSAADFDDGGDLPFDMDDNPFDQLPL